MEMQQDTAQRTLTETLTAALSEPLTAPIARSKPKHLKGGSRKGIPNRVGVEVRVMIENALAAAGGEKYLREQARDNPTAFMALVGKLLPRDMNIKAEVDVNVRHQLIERAVCVMMGKALPVIEQPPPDPLLIAKNNGPY